MILIGDYFALILFLFSLYYKVEAIALLWAMLMGMLAGMMLSVGVSPKK